MFCSFVDRDMLSLFSGGGIGHKSMRTRLRTFREDLEAAFGRNTQSEWAGDSSAAEQDGEDIPVSHLWNTDLENDDEQEGDNESVAPDGGESDEDEGRESEPEVDDHDDEDNGDIMGEEDEYGYDLL
jgi:hypothetical protein